MFDLNCSTLIVWRQLGLDGRIYSLSAAKLRIVGPIQYLVDLGQTILEHPVALVQDDKKSFVIPADDRQPSVTLSIPCPGSH